ncbi:MAG: FAD:protein FMN transferase [Proteobacteria bacterium]|nr:FAD:protein FMN transferase [Pseudomonadota bacterium]MDA0899980.1 FAD:protein FMN transferase [Pseudomonadota bacterium]
MVRALSLSFLVLLSACANETIKNITGAIYGTTYSVKYTENIDPNTMQNLVADELNRLDLIFSTYKLDTEIQRYNANPSMEGWSRDFENVYNLAFVVAAQSKGTFDPVSEEGLDYSGIAKGYAVDKVAELLEKNDIANYFVEIGGEISAKGSKYSEPWVFGVEIPSEDENGAYMAFKVPETGISVATSGEYREPGHIWGAGPRDIVSVTVADADAASADAWATALYVAGAEEGIALAEANDLAVFFILLDGSSKQSANWGKIFP